MKITILTLFPEQFIGFIETSIIKKAILKELVEIELVNIRDFTLDKHKRVDDKPYGGGAGLVMRAQPVLDALRSVKTNDSLIIVP
ncbi:MAG TPA: tRNA (guanosine(37)-N1)-methyltransferase TrmD, partial [Erysipelothrix sp.]|nr:tRNA (guanosine(37)-N1)-methyltransferase TrmD [Erysipelothrix sp.]